MGYYFSPFDQNAVAGTALIVVVVWFFAIILMSLNNLIIMYFEGYYPPAVPFYSSLLDNKRKKFRTKTCERDRLFNEWRKPSQDTVGHPGDLEQKLIDISQELVLRFPDKTSRVLPTKFGNAIRAFECYPEIVYGVDAIGFWPRIYLLLSQEVREAVAEAKAIVDMWVNIWALSCLIILEFCILLCGGLLMWLVAMFMMFGNWTITPLLWDLLYSAWIPVGAGLLVMFASNRSRDAAVEWGTVVKACFDLYLQPLARRLTGKKPSSEKELEELWSGFNEAFLYRRKISRNLQSGYEPKSQVELMDLSKSA